MAEKGLTGVGGVAKYTARVAGLKNWSYPFYRGRVMGCSQVARHLVLVQARPGSNPGTPVGR